MSQEPAEPVEEDRPDTAEVAELLEQLEDIEETADSQEERRVIRRTIRAIYGLAGFRKFGSDDLAQQIVGGFLLSAPFVVTEEVWSLAAAMNGVQWLITLVLVFAIGWGTLYRADQNREVETEAKVLGVPTRYVSLIVVSFLSVTILAFVFDAPDTFGATTSTTLKAISIGSVFSVIGAATADSVF